MKRELELTGATILSLEDFHEEIAKLLSFPHYYDKTLDGLWDCLNSYIDPRIKLNWTNHDISKDHMGYDFQRVVDVLQSSASNLEEFEFYLN
ncbi:barstar family protein [Halobacteriovorax sp. GB3]|uniref:barstar family protein n=1 Tax=Halobacteriovorax sp. GB3 TaxID=2719615 RepID=UPI00235EF623|nr:barstar family protein [Halobacteriovorax sp. GB3]MDD0851940.1 barstar family protein [Halobacteriovorax sp. GB3]